MINLLPPQTKNTYRYARHNRKLLHWIIACALSLTGGLLLAGGGYLYLNRAITDTNKQIDGISRQLQAQNLPAVQKKVTSISNNLKLAVQVLSQEVLFSKLLKQLASVTPSNTILTNLTITQSESTVDITAQTTNYDAATQLQVNLADPKNQIFSKADIISISCSGGASTGKYPCSVNIRALFATDNPFLFINDQRKTTP
jgi:Tfp pilus assembly protein PilN